MSPRYEFLEARMIQLVTDRETLSVIDAVHRTWIDDGDAVAVIVGDPSDCAGIVHASRRDMINTLEDLLEQLKSRESVLA